MGAWGHGIFENDNAADILVRVYESFEKEVVTYLDGKSDYVLDPDDMADHVLAHLGLIRIIAEGVVRTEERHFDELLCFYRVPETEKLQAWKERMVRVHINFMEQFPIDPSGQERMTLRGPYDPQKDLRLIEIIKLFDRLIELSKAGSPVEGG